MITSRRLTNDITVIIPAAGRGQRMMEDDTKSPPKAGTRRNSARTNTRSDGAIPKAFMSLAGRPMLLHSIEKFRLVPGIREIIIAIRPPDRRLAEGVILRYLRKLPRKASYPEIKLVAGGAERHNSVANSLAISDPASRIILVHDAARPLVEISDIIRLIKAVRQSGAAILAVPVVDTIKQVNAQGRIRATLPRAFLRAAQTPQGFSRPILMKAYRFALPPHQPITDDAALVEQMGHPVQVVTGHFRNIKITTPADKILAERLLKLSKVP